MTGFTPSFLASLWSSIAPASEPWSVSATAGISSSAARATSAGIRHAPSRIEYSEWTWRWTKGASDTGTATLLPAQDRTFAAGRDDARSRLRLFVGCADLLDRAHLFDDEDVVLRAAAARLRLPEDERAAGRCRHRHDLHGLRLALRA